MTGQVIAAHGREYIVKSEAGESRLFARGRMKGKTEILVGDFVTFEQDAIVSVLPRKTRFIRPNVANVELICAVLSPEPKPDFLMLDKLLASAGREGAEVVFAVNKNDLGREVYRKVCEEYGAFYEIFSVSAAEKDNLAALKERLKGRLTALAGQSAVGKSSLVNAMFGASLKVGDLSAIGRGKHTTTASRIYFFGDWQIMDTPGFAALETDMDETELAEYYPEFSAHSGECRFRGCSHTGEPGCAVAALAESGEIPEGRYERYKQIYAELKGRRKRYE